MKNSNQTTAPETKTLIVVEVWQGEEKVKAITYLENFPLSDATDTYGDYGQKNDEIGEGWDVKAYTFWNGHNWQSFVLNEYEFGSRSVERIDEDEESEILAAYTQADFPVEYERGVRTATVGNYDFTQSLFASNPWIAEVK